MSARAARCGNDPRGEDFADCGCGCTPATKPWPHTMILGNCARAIKSYQGGSPVIVEEHGHLMSGGEVHVWSDDPDVQRVYPLELRIEHGKQHGGHVVRRRVVVVDDWEEI